MSLGRVYVPQGRELQSLGLSDLRARERLPLERVDLFLGLEHVKLQRNKVPNLRYIKRMPRERELRRPSTAER